MHLMVTDLPVPEPPMMTTLSPLADIQINMIQDDFLAARKALADAGQPYLGEIIL